MDTWYVYVLRSVEHPEKTYAGFTGNLNRRIAEHNSGSQVYTRRYAPWELVTYIIFFDKLTASRFEKYLKTPSGKAFIRKHWIGEF